MATPISRWKFEPAPRLLVSIASPPLRFYIGGDSSAFVIQAIVDPVVASGLHKKQRLFIATVAISFIDTVPTAKIRSRGTRHFCLQNERFYHRILFWKTFSFPGNITGLNFVIFGERRYERSFETTGYDRVREY